MSFNIGNLAIVTWNVRGLGDPNKCTLVKDVLRSARASILFMQETKLNAISFEKLNAFLPHTHSNFTCLLMVRGEELLPLGTDQ
jgi:exonuclease III